MAAYRSLALLLATGLIGVMLALAPALAVENADSVGVTDRTTGLWYLRGPDGGTTSFYFGDPGDYPIVGDWDCDGVDTPGLYRQSDGYVYLRNTNTVGPADVKFFFGNPGDVPLAGDFDANGCDTVSIYRPSNQTFYIINTLGSNDGGLGAADASFVFGNPGDKPFTADFDDDGRDTVGLHRESTGFVYYRNSLTSGNADNQFFFGDPDDQIVAGRWSQNPVDGSDTVGIFRPNLGTFYLRFSDTQGNADVSFPYGNGNMAAVSGTWGSLRGADAPPPGPPVGSTATVVNIVDGDTIDVRFGSTTDRVRLIGIDTPELGQCYYQEAKNRLTNLISGKTVTLVRDVSDRDRYDRILRYVHLGNEFINDTMVRQGFAVAVEYPPDTAKAVGLASAQAEAKNAGRGLWSGCSVDPVPTCHPSYPTVCIPPPPPDLDCGDIPYRRFKVLPPDPHRFDADKDGIGCESG